MPVPTFDVNFAKGGATRRAGKFFFRLKELMVASGRFEVIGSGDGTTRHAYRGFTSPISGPNQGSGGQWDCLQTGSGVAGGGAGDWDVAGWCALEAEDGSQVLFIDSAGTPDGSWGGYGRVFFSIGNGFDGSVVGVATPPGQATDEQAPFGGTRGDANGADMFYWNGDGSAHFFCHDTAVNGIVGWGWVLVDTTAVVRIYRGRSAVSEADESSIGGMFYNTGATYAGYRTGDGGVFREWLTSFTEDGSLKNGVPVDPQNGFDTLTPVFLHVTPALVVGADFGYLEDVLQVGVAGRAYPDIYDDGTRVWLNTQSGYAVPWPDTSTTPDHGSGTTYDARRVLPQAGIAADELDTIGTNFVTTYYRQRVWDAGAGGRWCYYEKTVIDASPDAGETSPNYVGAISAHSVVAVRQV